MADAQPVDLDGPHPSGDVKTCAGCPAVIHRLRREGPKRWRERRFCTGACASATRPGQRRPVEAVAAPRRTGLAGDTRGPPDPHGDPMTNTPTPADVPGWRRRIRGHLADIEREADTAGEMLASVSQLLDDVTLDRLVTRLIADGLPTEPSDGRATPVKEIKMAKRDQVPSPLWGLLDAMTDSNPGLAETERCARRAIEKDYQITTAHLTVLLSEYDRRGAVEQAAADYVRTGLCGSYEIPGGRSLQQEALSALIAAVRTSGAFEPAVPPEVTDG